MGARAPESAAVIFADRLETRRLDDGTTQTQILERRRRLGAQGWIEREEVIAVVVVSDLH